MAIKWKRCQICSEAIEPDVDGECVYNDGYIKKYLCYLCMDYIKCVQCGKYFKEDELVRNIDRTFTCYSCIDKESPEYECEPVKCKECGEYYAPEYMVGDICEDCKSNEDVKKQDRIESRFYHSDRR